MAENIFSVFSEVIQRLESAGFPYMVVGSVASMIYGEARLTRDMDLVIDVLDGGAREIVELFPPQEFYCPPMEMLASEFAERGQFNLIHHATGIKIDFILRKENEHARSEFARRRKEPFWENFEAYVASPEDVIIKKLEYFREGGSEKHLRDIRGILAQTEIDRTYLQYWLAQQTLQREWALV